MRGSTAARRRRPPDSAREAVCGLTLAELSPVLTRLALDRPPLIWNPQAAMTWWH